MVIRSQQMETFETYASDGYARELADHLKSFAPKLCEVVGEQAVREIVKSAIERARRYGLENRGPVRFYLELMCTFGSGFDSDPQLPWAFETLTDGSIPTDMFRAERLHERMTVYLDHVAGPEHQYAIDALKKLLEFNFEIAPREGWSERAAVRVMAHLYPQKYEFIGEAVASALAQQASAEAAKYGLPQGKGAAALAGTMFAMGHQICEDPFYPWIAAALKDPRIVDGEKRLARLVSKLRTYGTHVLAYFSQS